ncbi:DUF1996 domain-containing protein [Streptomyces sp. NPDC051907]|uniref:DUF1996 domain-containing protein n=1 Tax=Streptomyces sp. NPDC051907 TaxID=3155284 RepID=UPI00341E94AC
MRHTARRRPKSGRRVVVASIALILGGGGLIAVNTTATAGEGWGGEQNQTRSTGPAASTIKCPEVANGLPEVPEAARVEVDRELATLDTQITEAYQQFVDDKERMERDAQLAQNAVLDPLKDKRAASLDRIAVAIGKVAGERPKGVESMAACILQADDADANGAGDGKDQEQGQGQQGQGQQGQEQGQGDGQGNGSGGQAQNGPEASDFVDIQSVQPNVANPQQLAEASRGVFSTDCGVNENGKFNPDNVIVAPGVSNGAHHMHDYVGNQANDAFASDDDLANGQTTCRNQGDKSTYYWPVLRVQNGQNEADANADGGGKDKNVGEIQTPAEVTLNFVGSPVGKVTVMPRFLRIITGDAKAFVNGNANANASWSCTGFENRQLKDKYPICPEGSKVVRSFKFQSCWDGKNADSANHRTHVAFADQNGRCAEGFQAIPQLVQRIVYDVPRPVFDGESPAVFAVDSFPEQLHKPVTDHGDFINVFDDNLMRALVDCINDGRKCGPGEVGAPPAEEEPGEEPGGQPSEDPKPTQQPTQNPPSEPTEQPTQKPTEQPTEQPTQQPGGEPGQGGDKPGATPPPASGGDEQKPEPGNDGAEPGGQENPAATDKAEEPQADGSGGGAPAAQKPAAGTVQKPKAAAVESGAAAPDAKKSEAAAGTPGAQSTPPAGETGLAGGQQQAAEGGLAETGAQLWPSAVGAALLIAGVLLLRTRSRGEGARQR